ncbi:unnamed protein product [Caenorhabditis nigoni]
MSDARPDKRRIGQQEVHTESSPTIITLKGARRTQMPFTYADYVKQPALIGDEWPPNGNCGNWSANNNGLTDWDKCCETASKVPTHLTGNFDTSSLKMLTAKQPSEKISPDAGYVSPNEEDRKSSEHTNSYDVSASQSPSNDGASSVSTDEHIDVECMTTIEEMDTDEKDEDTIVPEEGSVEVKKEEAESEQPKDEPEPVVNIPQTSGTILTPSMQTFLQTPLAAPIPMTPETQILLGLGAKEFQDVMSAAERIRKPVSDSFGFMRSGSSAFSNIEPKELLLRSPSSTNINNNCSSTNNNNEDAAAPAVSSPSTPTTTSASFCRPPGLGPVALPPTPNGQVPMLVCPICGFMCPSKFHFNSHMNTHGDHQCSMCDYTSRTEGRLKKHMRESHTVEEQLKAGLELEPAKETSSNTSSSPKGSISSKDSSAASPINESFNLSTTLASILDSTSNAIAATASSTTEPPSALSALTLDMTSTPSLLSTLGQSNFGTSALDHIKAISENPNFMPEGGMNLASALGVVSQVIKGEPASPEKQSNGESRRSSSGKIKIFKCKQCGHQSLSKDDQWAHARSHIPAEKQLNCQHCNFVTEYKHHLEYHYRNHIGSKPFQCKKCSYNCVNKSMLNSHMKSHTNHYQFRCMDCTYATKYCHSLKLHLKKYNHRRVPEGIEMNGGDSSPTLSQSDATITFSPIVKQEIKSEPIEQQPSIAQPFQFNSLIAGPSFTFGNQMLLNKHLDNGLIRVAGLPSVPMQTFKCPLCEFVAGTQEEQIRHSMSHILSSNQVPTTIASLYNTLNLPTLGRRDEDEENMECDVKIEDDNTTEDSHCGDEEMEHSSDSAVSPTGSSQVSSVDDDVKCKTSEQNNAHSSHSPISSNDSALDRDGESADDAAPHSPSDTTSVASPPHVPVPIAAPIPISLRPDQAMFQNFLTQAAFALNMVNRNMLQCEHCNIPFNNQEAYNTHMMHHTPGNPFKCGKCQYQCHDTLSFALHMYQAKHQ